MIYEDSPYIQCNYYKYNSLDLPSFNKPITIDTAYEQFITHLERAEDFNNNPEGRCDSIYLATLIFQDWYADNIDFWKYKYRDEIKKSHFHKIFIKIYKMVKDKH